MVTTHPRAAGNGEGPLAGNSIETPFPQSGTLWQDLLEPLWPRERSVGLAVVLPFPPEGEATTLVLVRSRVGEEPAGMAQDVDTRLRAFHRWLDSLPAVPRLSPEAWDRGNLY